MASIVLNKPSGGAMTITAEDGTSTETVTIPANGVMSNPPTIQTFTASGTWTKPDGCKVVKVTVVGGGGGAYDTSVQSYATGGTGGVAIKYIDVTAVSSSSVTIGSGGSVHGSGGTSSFGAYCSATGGSAPTGYNPGGAGGTATGGDINISSMQGGSDSGSSSFPADRLPSILGVYGMGGRGGTNSGNGNAGIVVVEEFY